MCPVSWHSPAARRFWSCARHADPDCPPARPPPRQRCLCSGCLRCDSASPWRVDGAVVPGGQRAAGSWVNTTGCTTTTNKLSHTPNGKGFTFCPSNSHHTLNTQTMFVFPPRTRPDLWTRACWRVYGCSAASTRSERRKKHAMEWDAWS